MSELNHSHDEKIDKDSFKNAKKKYDDVRSGSLPQDMELFVDMVENNDSVKIWRKMQDDGLYTYMILACIKDLPLDDFYNFYSDIRFRSQWDSHTNSVDVISEEPIEEQSENFEFLLKQTLRWTVNISFPLSVREYLFNREIARFDNAVIFLDKETSELSRQKAAKGVKVKNYNAVIVLDQDGHNMWIFQHYLTAFDLQMKIPKVLVNWAVSTGIKSFIKSHRDGFKSYQSKKNIELK